MLLYRGNRLIRRVQGTFGAEQSVAPEVVATKLRAMPGVVAVITNWRLMDAGGSRRRML